MNIPLLVVLDKTRICWRAIPFAVGVWGGGQFPQEGFFGRCGRLMGACVSFFGCGWSFLSVCVYVQYVGEI